MIPGDIELKLADQQDKDQLVRLLQKETFVHRHLGWQPPLAWLGKQPFLVLKRNDNIISVLACPPDEDGITWLRLFAVEPGFSIFRAWNSLWPSALKWIQDHSSVESVNSLVVNNKMIGLLEKSGFVKGYRVVVLNWDIVLAQWPDTDGDILIRPMEPDDFSQVYLVDQKAFEKIWRNSKEQLKIAFVEAFSATVAELDQKVVGYQISTSKSQIGHLARLAVDPAFQNKGVGSSLLKDVLDRLQRQGIVQVTVNTQMRNKASLELYQKFGFKQLDKVYPVYQYRIT